MDERRPEKKEYTRPAIETEEVYETLALGCCKIHPTPDACDSNLGAQSFSSMS